VKKASITKTGNAMTIELTPEHQRIIERVVHSGAYPDAEHVISAALEALAEDIQAHAPPRKSRLWELREGLNLGDDTSIRELIDEGRE
jgi:Arc/MetJ-type ribon-helix-helix transcriptional regulator